MKRSTVCFFKFHESQQNKQVVVKQEKALTMEFPNGIFKIQITVAKQVIALLSVIARIVHFLAECEFAMQQFYPIVQLILNFIIEQGCFDEKNNFIGKKELYLSLCFQVIQFLMMNSI